MFNILFFIEISFLKHHHKLKTIYFFHFSEVEMWNLNQNNTSVDLLIKKPIVIGVKQFLDVTKVPYDVLIDDLQKAIDMENPPKEEIENLQNRKGAYAYTYIILKHRM